LAGEINARCPADLRAVEAMAATMADRGPDGGGAWANGGVALAHRRLRIIDLSEAGRQPMVDPELRLGAWVTTGFPTDFRLFRRSDQKGRRLRGREKPTQRLLVENRYY
jgi:hypothetical protein